MYLIFKGIYSLALNSISFITFIIFIFSFIYFVI